MRLSEIAAKVGAELHGADADVTGVAAIMTAKAGELSFLTAGEYEQYVATTGATALIVGGVRSDFKGSQLVHKNPYWAYAKTAQLLHPRARPAAGVSPQAVVAGSAQVDPSATVFPLAFVGERARIGPRVVIHPGAYIGDDVEIGDDSEVRANAVLEYGVRLGKRVLVHGGAVLGADGFGFAPGPDGLAKIPQIGRVLVADDVEIGGLTTVDRGALEDTKVGRGTKLDSHVHIGHGSETGEFCVMSGFAGMAGSAKLGNGVAMGGHSAINNKVLVPDGSQVGACSAVVTSPEAKGTFVGFPAVPVGDWRRQQAMIRRLPEMDKRLRELEKKLAQLTGEAKP